MKKIFEWLAAAGILLGVLMLGAMGDAPVETDEEIQNIAEQEQASRDAEFLRLRQQAYRMTDIK